jgi:plasmid stabilization system protein ParE
MPRVIFSEAALEDLVRLREFLASRSPEAAEKAKSQVLHGLKSLAQFPESNKPVNNMPHQRELVIKFGARGYVARYRYERGGDVVVLRLRHQRED